MSVLFDPAALIQKIPTLLPESSKSINSPHDALALLAHSILSILAFRLAHAPNNVLDDAWNKNGPEDYSFHYNHEQSSLQFVVKVSKMGSRTVFNAIALESDKIAAFDIATEDFTSAAFYPHDLSTSNPAPLINGYIASNRVSDFTSQFALKIVKKLVPGLRKDGYIEATEESTTCTPPHRSQDPQPSRPRPYVPPEAPDRDARLPNSDFPQNSREIGRRDWDPFGGQNLFAPPSLFPRNGGDGMYVGPSHPIFGGENYAVPQRGPWGGDGFLPPLGAPPGARFDPVGPDFLPGGRGVGQFGPGGRRPPGGGNMGGPDNDEFMPPGMGDMFM
ncbi:PI31 proteasome regulator N-terminal-domain-containing protein [Cyathus striatus]|nr:PI31 proteasome regulator N-terminal-domain-containing protein [Cyathus striatus]